MKNTKILEMLNNGKIDELKLLLQDEIFTEQLGKKSGTKNRYAAMKRYFKYCDDTRLSVTLPCKDVEVHGKKYNSFVNGYSFALTTESIGTMESFDKTKGIYFNVEKLVVFPIDNNVEKLNINQILAEAKAKVTSMKKQK